MKTTYSGATSGKGAVYEWNGNRNVGSGKMEIIESIASSRVVVQLDFITLRRSQQGDLHPESGCRRYEDRLDNGWPHGLHPQGGRHLCPAWTK